MVSGTCFAGDELLLKSFISFFNCGKAYVFKDYVEYQCTSYKDIDEKIIPFFTKYPVIGVKHEDYKDWVKAAELIKTKSHLTKEGFEKN